MGALLSNRTRVRHAAAEGAGGTTASALPREDWKAIQKGWDGVPRLCKSPYANLYAEAARRLRWACFAGAL